MDPVRVLVLCTGNSARSILGEALLNAQEGVLAHSAGSRPKGEPHPMALKTLADAGYPTDGYRSKSWDEFASTNETAPAFDIVITVCDSAAGESCPLWHGAPVRAHWSLPDPAAEPPERQEAAFRDTLQALSARIERFAVLRLGELDAATLQQKLNEIGVTTRP